MENKVRKMGRTLDLKHTNVFTRNWEALKDNKYRFIINQGGSRSSKTYSLCQVIMVYALTNPGQIISVVRRSMPALRSSIMRDFFEILKENGIYEQDHHNKTAHIYTFPNGTEVEFFSVDDEQKLRGRKRNILLANEGNELTFEEWNQLVMRTTGNVFVDFNPSDTNHWIYDLINQENALLIKSTYNDNPFLDEPQVEYIENLMNVDENWYKIYALGERPVSTSRIYSHFQRYVDIPEINDKVYGLDFGFNHPTALVECSFISNKVYIREMIYLSKLTSSDLITKMNSMDIPKGSIIFCDSARPEIITDIKRAGWTRATSADKAVKAGIDRVKSSEIFVHIDSENIWTEYKLYSWRTHKDIVLDEPVKLHDDSMDAIRYALYNHSKRGPARTPFFIG